MWINTTSERQTTRFYKKTLTLYLGTAAKLVVMSNKGGSYG